MAVCQPCVPALAAAALMAEDDNPAQPRSLTLMAGPVDGRINPTAVNDLACGRSIGWFEQNVIDTVPLRFKGAMRRVYPGFLQLAAFLNMNRERHRTAFAGLYDDIVEGNHDARGVDDALLRRVLHRARPGRRVLPRDGQRDLPGAPARARRAHVARPAGEPGRDPAHGAAHRRGRARRHQRAGPDDGRAGAVQRARARREAPAPAARRAATTACSAGGAGRRRSIRSCGR